jgi:putative FmdB family regulatory protein
MPIYAYRCEACGHAKDVLQKFSDPLLTVCPSCGAEAFKKQVTAAGFQLKGSGWYVTDFRGDSKGAAAKPEPASADSGKADGGKTDAAAPDKGKAEPGKAEVSKGDAAAKSASAPAPAAAPAPSSGSGPASGAQ